ncbi:MAG: ABC transporter ATP-binding protein [Bacteroidales bacterium]|nr:ABC transporter ATP-binding protein [Bacteroidales bacterium]
MSSEHKPVVAESISKTFGQVTALQNISFETERGEMFGVIGPDGAGKTTLFRILTTLLVQTSGSAFVDGYDVKGDFRKIRKIIGYMPGRFSLYGDLSVEENLNFFASIFKVNPKDNYYLIKDIFHQLEPFRNRKASALSGGMKQKLALSCALIHKPSVLFLDEPTTGVDPVSRREFWQMLDRLKAIGITIIVSTAYMDEALLCDRIALMKNGILLGVNSPAGMVASYNNRLLAVKGDDMHSILKVLRDIKVVKSAYSFGHEHHAAISPDFGGDAVEKISQELTARGLNDILVKSIKPSVEDCYMELSAN